MPFRDVEIFVAHGFLRVADECYLLSMKSLTGYSLLTALAVLAFAPTASAQTQLLRHVIASGAVASASPTNIMVGTIGQTIIGRSASSSHVGFLGFWYTYPRQVGPGAVREEYSNAVTGASAAVRVAPNPVVDVANVTVSLPRGGDVHLALYDGLGQERMRLIDGTRPAGTTTVQIPARDLESGDYLLVLVIGGERSATPLRVIK